MMRARTRLTSAFLIVLCSSFTSKAADPLIIYTVNYPLQYFAAAIAGDDDMSPPQSGSAEAAEVIWDWRQPGAESTDQPRAARQRLRGPKR